MIWRKKKQQSIDYTPKEDSIINLLLYDDITMPQAYDTDPTGECWYYSHCNTRPRLSRTNFNRVWLQPVIKAKDLEFYIFQALMTAVTKRSFEDLLTKKVFDDIQISADNTLQNVLLNPSWREHEEYIISKIESNKKCYYSQDLEINEIVLLPAPNLTGVIGGSNSGFKTNYKDFNIAIHSGHNLHHITISNMPNTIDKYFEKMMSEALE